MEEVYNSPNKILGLLFSVHIKGVDGTLDKEIGDIMQHVPATGWGDKRFSPDQQWEFCVGFYHELGSLGSLF